MKSSFGFHEALFKGTIASSFLATLVLMACSSFQDELSVPTLSLTFHL